MSSATRKIPPWAGFLVGLLAIAVPLGLYLGIRELRSRPAPEGRRPPAASREAPSTPAAPPAGAARDEARPGTGGLRVAGASVRDSRPLPDDAALGRASERVADWLAAGGFDPFAGAGIDSLRLFALEAECWHRLAGGESDPARRAAYEGEFMRRARVALDPSRLRRRLESQRTAQGWIEILMFAARGVERGLDREAIRSAFQPGASKIAAEMDRGTPSSALLTASYLETIGLDVGRPSDRYREAGILARQPRETRVNIGDIFSLTQEVLAIAGGRSSIVRVSPVERDYLHRVLPFFSLTYVLFQRQEMVGDLLSCLNLLSMTETYGYREGMRVMLERQNPDGSFGEATERGKSGRIAQLPATTACVTAISLERARARGGR